MALRFENFNDMMTSIGRTIGNISTLILLIKLIANAINYYNQGRYIHQVLLSSSETCYMTCPVYEKEHPVQFDYISFTAFDIYEELSDMYARIHRKLRRFKEATPNSDIFHIGGPLANTHTNTFLSTHSRFNFKIHLPKKEKSEYGDINNLRVLFDTSNQTSFEIGTNKLEVIKGKKDYGIFIRIPKDENNQISQTTHIIFACYFDGTLRAVKFFSNCYKWISKHFGKKRYCFAVPIDLTNGQALPTPNEIIDLTQEFFG